MPLDPANAIRLSMLVGAAATTLAVVPAIAVGYALSRWRFPGKFLVSTLVMAPLVLPPVVTGLLLLWTFGRSSPLGQLFESIGLPVPFSLFGAILSALVVGFPFFVLTTRAAFDAVDPRLEELSRAFGVPPVRTFFRVSLPLAMPGIAAGTVLAFARALGEFGATAVIAGNIEGKTRTIALAIYSSLDAPDGDSAARTLLLASIAMSATALFGFEALNRWHLRRLHADG